MTRRPSFAELSTISMRVTLVTPLAAHLASYSHWDYLDTSAAKNNSFLVRTVLCPIQFAGVFGQVELHGQLSVLGLKHLAGS